MSEVAAHLQTHEDDRVLFLARHAGWILRYETVEDLMQGLHVRVLERGKEFEYRGRDEFLKWIYTVARTLLADRNEYWSALKRKDWITVSWKFVDKPKKAYVVRVLPPRGD